MSARELVLERIRRAVADAAPVPVSERHIAERSGSSARVVTAFADRVRDYGATVIHTDDAATAVASVLLEQGVRRIGIARDLDARLRPAGVELVQDEALSARQLDQLDGALTTCAAACADTGTIALDGGSGQGRRALTLLPDLHVCIVREDQVVETVPELLRRLEPAATDGRPLILISGPSATSDIELQRVEGVHGPRRLVVIVER